MLFLLLGYEFIRYSLYEIKNENRGIPSTLERVGPNAI
jgi:hypothetical protein